MERLGGYWARKQAVAIPEGKKNEWSDCMETTHNQLKEFVRP